MIATLKIIFAVMLGFGVILYELLALKTCRNLLFVWKSESIVRAGLSLLFLIITSLFIVSFIIAVLEVHG